MSVRSLLVSFSFVVVALVVPGCADDGPSMWCENGDCLCDASGRWIPESWLCDGDNDCRDWQDERGCPGVRVPELPCHGLSCWCGGGREIASDEVCDGTSDCDGGEDERGCRTGSSEGGGSSGGGSSGPENQACWDCGVNGCTLYYATTCY